jgi:hypothetical protein
MADAYEQPLCAMCDKPSTQLCGGCVSIKYCSRTCQKLDWRVHKLVCKTYKDFLASRPSTEHHSAIYFPVDEAGPRFIWLQYYPSQVRDINHAPLSQFAQLGLPTHHVDHQPLTINVALGRRIDDRSLAFSIFNTKNHRDDSFGRSFASIDKELAVIFRDACMVWATNIQDDRLDNAKYLDLGPMDLRHAVDHIRFSYDVLEEALQKMYQEVGAVQGVRLNCNGDHKIFDRDTFEAVLEPAATINVTSCMPTPIADAVGLPLVVRQTAPSLIWRDRDMRTHTVCYSACMLNPPHQTDATGSLIVVRKDGHPLHPIHIQALSGYATLTLMSPTHPKNACIHAGMLKADRITRLSKEGFEKYYATEWRKMLGCPAGLPPSPYDTAGLAAFKGRPASVNIMEQ